jgi:serine/threonine protein kinase
VIDGYSQLPEPLLARYISGALQGLDYLHSQGNTHDNLKASNILLSHGVAKLTDFGLSASISHLTLLDQPYWHAPEVLESKLFSKESDIWSLGATIIEVLTKHPPFHDLSPEEARIRILTEMPPIPASASPHLRDFLVIVFNRDPKERPAAKDLLDLFWIKTNAQPAGAPPSLDSGGLSALHFPRELRMNPKPDEIMHLLSDESDDDTSAPKPKEKGRPGDRKIRGKAAKDTNHVPGVESGECDFEFEDAGPGTKALLTLPGVDTDDDELVFDDELPNASPRPTLVPLPPPLVTLPGVENDDSDPGFDDELPTASPLLQLPPPTPPLRDMESGPATQYEFSDDQPLSLPGHEDQNGSLQGPFPATLSVFAEDPSAGNEFEFDAHLVNRPLPDFSFMDEDDPDERAIFAQGQRITELRTETLSVVRELGDAAPANLLANLQTIRRNLEEEPSLRNDIFRELGVLPIIELFEYSTLGDDAINELILENVYRLCCGQDQIKENFCLLGGIPPVISFLKPQTDVRFRRFAVQILTEICRDSAGQKHELNNNNTQMFVACNGLSALVEILSYDFETEADMICTAIQTVVDILMKRQSTSRKEIFCRLFVQAGLLPPMSSILDYFANHTDLNGRPEGIGILLDNICWLITTLSQSDSLIRSKLSLPEISRNIVAAMYSLEKGIKYRLSQENTLSLCQSLRNICLDDDLRDNLTAAGALHMACEMLKVDLDGDKHQVDQIQFYLLAFVSGMCKRSKFAQMQVAVRTSIVAKTSLLPALRQFLNSHLQSTALGIIMTLFVVHEIDAEAMNALIRDDLIDIYIDNLPQPNWGTMAINALAALSADKTLPIETFLLKKKSIEAFGLALAAVNTDHAPSFVRDLVTICERFSNFVNELVTMTFTQSIVKRLTVPVKGFTQLPAALLELVKTLFKSGSPRALQTLLGCGELRNVVERFAESANIRERTFANEILKLFGS